MAKKIRGAKVKKEDIQKNSGKNISHTISKIKAHERYYTTLLVILFMFVITISMYFGLKVSSKMNYTLDESEYSNGFSYTGRLVSLNNKNNDNMNSIYTVTLSNMTNNNVNYLLRIEKDEETIKNCNCESNIVSYDKIRYSLEDRVERSFTNNDMVLTTGFVHPLEREEIPIKIWLVNENEGEQFFGKIVMEQIQS